MVIKLSLIVPFYNEEAAISHFVNGILPVLDAMAGTEWEILCVDDGSSDDTLRKLISLSETDARFRVLELSRNFGKEAALTAGLDAASGDAVVIIDADLQDPPDMIPQMVRSWRDGAEVVLGRRIDRSSDSMLKRKTALWFYSLHNRLAHIRIPENVGDFRLMDRCVVEALKRLPERQRFMKGLFAWVGFRTVTLDYVRAPRAAGLTKFSGYSLWNFALEGFTSFSSAPIRLWTYLGTVGALLAILYALFIVFRTIVCGNPVPGYASLFVAIIFFSSVQIISIGMLGEYIGRIYMETKQRPIYVLRRTY
ncbi:glycosyltransferase family 2 protein [Gluconobacter kanchanaburiensis]|uniref:Glycosyl transferase n=1 Tax=Gluconobacter kanchanaburiensis NBRC 103587 TaxID=1307948 RepID=A0A511B8X8_9PROT|nr:glycosyltransferase family 2 protein [Gluconobacter kanchanaburiensis]MBF0862600.1 glycosyltransferase family 2 protein [Gluconobacter kanchanaburiensis]GBR71947.1 glycosyltransferase [Gluconobacter kanchanaburiensis NBRC 103587]GEK96905.1 glycosyl transferase [Gluconobacter kanchanaburiensis NBRC 103587]